MLGNSKSRIETIEKALNQLSDETRQRIQTQIKKETELEKAKDKDEENQILIKYSETLYVLLQFERIYHLIYGSQIRLLNHLNSSFKETTESVQFFYNNAIKENPTLEGYDYKNYLSYLESQGLIILGEKESILITAFGRDFLKYMIDSGLTDLKPY